MAVSGQLEDGMLAMVGARPAGTQAQRATTLAVCDRAGLGLDIADPEQLREAATLARPLLDALGLLGGSPPAKVNVAAYAHGSQSGVDFHLAAGHLSLCAACQRWVDVHENRKQSCAEGGCGSVSAYWAHRNAREQTCEASRAAYRVYCRERAAKGPAGR